MTDRKSIPPSRGEDAAFTHSTRDERTNEIKASKPPSLPLMDLTVSLNPGPSWMVGPYRRMSPTPSSCRASNDRGGAALGRPPFEGDRPRLACLRSLEGRSRQASCWSSHTHNAKEQGNDGRQPRGQHVRHNKRAMYRHMYYRCRRVGAGSRTRPSPLPRPPSLRRWLGLQCSD